MSPVVGAASFSCSKAEDRTANSSSETSSGNGGTIIIEGGNADLDEIYIRRHSKVRPGSYVVLMVLQVRAVLDQDIPPRRG